MKSIQGIFFALGFLVSIAAQGRESGLIEIFNYAQKEQSIISIINTGYNYNEVKLVCNTTGESLIKESLEDKPTYQTLIDLKTFNDGNYTVQLEGNGTNVQKTFNVQHGELRDANLAKDIFEATANMKFFLDDNNDNLIVSFINPHQEQLKVKIINLDKNKVVEQINGSNTFAYSDVIDLGYLRKGNYRATLVSGNTSYHFDFTR
jgi:lipocalin